MRTTRLCFGSGFLALMLGGLACNTADPEFDAFVFPERIAFVAERQYPEGLAYAPTLDRFLVSSLTRGNVGTVDQHGRYTDLLTDNRLISSVGIRVRDGKLYVCNGDLGVAANSRPETMFKTAGLLVFNLATRQLLRSVRLDSLLPDTRHFANDVAFDAQGNAYVTDSFAPVIYKVTPGYEASIFSNDPLFSDALVAGTPGFNLNGIVYHPDDFLIVVKANEGKLFKVSVRNPGVVTEITGANLPGGDGLVLLENSLYVVHGQNKVSRVRSSDGWATATIIKTDTVGYAQATTNVAVKGRIYTLNGRLNDVLAAVATKDTNRLRAVDYSLQQFDAKTPK